MTQEMLAEQGLTVSAEGVAELMEGARATARAAAKDHGDGGVAERAGGFARDAGFETRFVGYEATAADTVVGALESEKGTLLAKLEDSPFYPEGGGQVSDSGTVATERGRARVTGVFRVGDDQALTLEPLEGEIGAGDQVHAEVERAERVATMRNHTATHLLHAALRERLGDHVRQAGSYVGPDKLRFDFSHGERLSDEELADVEARVNGWIADNLAVRAIETSLDEAKSLGAMALFGEKYGDWVRMVEVDEVSRELCGGTHVRSTGEVGLFHVTTEASSASNVRRIEALTGAAATELFEERTARLRELSKLMKAPESELVRAAEKLGKQVKELKKKPAADAADEGAEADRLVEAAEDVGGAKAVVERAEAADPKALLGLSDRVRQSLGESAVVLAMDAGGKLALVANVAPELVERGVNAPDLAQAAADVAGGGGGGRDTVAQAGGGDPAKTDEALAAARAALEQALGA